MASSRQRSHRALLRWTWWSTQRAPTTTSNARRTRSLFRCATPDWCPRIRCGSGYAPRRFGACVDVHGRTSERHLFIWADVASRSSGCDRGGGIVPSRRTARRASRCELPTVRSQPGDSCQQPLKYRPASCTSIRRFAARRRDRSSPTLPLRAPHRSRRPTRKCPLCPVRRRLSLRLPCPT